MQTPGKQMHNVFRKSDRSEAAALLGHGEAFNLLATLVTVVTEPSAKRLELGDLSQQALQARPLGVGGQTRERGAVAVIGKQGDGPAAHSLIEAIGHKLQRRVVVRGARRTQDPVQAVRARAGNAQPAEPSADLPVQRRRQRLARQQVVGQPAAEVGLGRFVEGRDSKMRKDRATMPAPRPSAQS